MTEIEKMFENTNIKPKQEGYCDWDSDCPYPDIINSGCGDECPYWKYKDEVNYPPFTAKKQLELIKLISKQGQVIIENWEKDNRGFNVTFRANSNLRYITMDCITRKTVEDALAQIINDIWQDLTDQEKEEIRGILNE